MLFSDFCCSSLFDKDYGLVVFLSKAITIDEVSLISGLKVIKKFSCSTQLRMKIFLLLKIKISTIVGILTFMSRKISILCFSEPEKMLNFLIFLYLPAFKILCSAELSMKIFLYPRAQEHFMQS